MPVLQRPGLILQVEKFLIFLADQPRHERRFVIRAWQQTGLQQQFAYA